MEDGPSYINGNRERQKFKNKLEYDYSGFFKEGVCGVNIWETSELYILFQFQHSTLKYQYFFT
jgi:hypothetical protein